jgi:hypothetical protein
MFKEKNNNNNCITCLRREGCYNWAEYLKYVNPLSTRWQQPFVVTVELTYE